jgi:hypothetical protein
MRIWLPCLVLLCACRPNPFAPASHLEGLRIVAVRAQPPEVAPGDSVTLDALAVNTDDAADGGGIEIDWNACTLPSLPGSTSIPPQCIQSASGKYLVPLGHGLEVTGQVPPIDLSKLGLADSSGGIYLPIRARAKSPSDEVDAAYHLRVSHAGAAANRNPKLTDLLLVAAGGSTTALHEDTPVTVHASDRLTLRASFSKDSAESYSLPPPHQTEKVTELLRVSWFATAGSFSQPATGQSKPDTVWRADQYLPARGTRIEIFAVARDERGGTDFARRVLILR